MSPCVACGFTLWNPVADLTVSAVGVYSDARFPGRSLLVLNEHYEDLTHLPLDVAAAFHADLRAYADALREVTGAQRLNYAVLGNAEPHVHWHIFPRHPQTEPAPDKSPWDDPRPRLALPAAQLDGLVIRLQEALGGR